MTAYTPNFDLPYPTAPDDPCLFAQQWCDFTNATTGVLDRFEAVANRTNPAVPIAKLDLTRPVTLNGDSILAFDAVSANNAGMVDFDVSRSRIRINRPGNFYAEANVFFSPTTTGLNAFTVTIDSTFSLMQRTTRTNDFIAFAVGIVYGTPLESNIFPFNPFDITVRVNATLAPSFIVNTASLAVWWYADEVRL